MTRKETALENLRKAIEEFNTLGNYNIYISNVLYQASKKRIFEIEEKTEYYQNQIQNLIRKSRIKEYFESAEGIAEKERMEARLEELQDENDALVKKTTEEVNEILKQEGIITYPYKVEDISHDRWILVNQNSSKKYYLRIEVNFSKDFWGRNEVTPQINVSAIGSVNITGSSEGKDYYMTIGTLFANGEKIFEIFNNVCGPNSEYGHLRENIKEEANKINNWLNNPLATVA